MDRLVTLSKIIAALDPIKGEKSLQKLVYLNEAYGDKLGYKFRWNNYGPISFQLQREVQEIQTLGLISIEKEDGIPVYRKSHHEEELTPFWKKQVEKTHLTEHSQRVIEFVKELGGRREDPLFLEALASLDYIQRQQDLGYQVRSEGYSEDILHDAEQTLQQLQVY